MRRRLAIAAALLTQAALPAQAACVGGMTSEGRLAAVIDARSLRLDDGRILRLAGLEAAGPPPPDLAAGALLRWRAQGEPDRYGRIHATVMAADAHATLQEDMLTSGAAVVAGEIVDPTCMAEFRAAEATARAAKRGIWNLSSAIKNAERSGHSSGEDAALVGQFGIFEGKVLSVREQGATVYVNFGTRAARGLTVTVAQPQRRRIETGGVALAALQGRKVRVRGFVENRGGLRIEAKTPEQIELLD